MVSSQNFYKCVIFFFLEQINNTVFEFSPEIFYSLTVSNSFPWLSSSVPSTSTFIHLGLFKAYAELPLSYGSVQIVFGYVHNHCILLKLIRYR